MPYFQVHHGNPSGGHRVARRARQAVEESRDSVAAHVGCSPNELIFTSGGTESDNLAVRGVLEARPGLALCSAIEHPAVIDTVELLGGSTVNVDESGLLDLDDLGTKLSSDISLVSVMMANNEIGVIQDMAAIAERVREAAPQAVVHTDAVQAAPWCELAPVTAVVDLLSLSAHKFGGPNGVGALVHRKGVALSAQQSGGGQEQERRGGTQNVAGIVGLAAALDLTVSQRGEEYTRVKTLRDRLTNEILAGTAGVRCTVPQADGLPNISHLLLDSVESEVLLVLLEREGVMASAASSCASGAVGHSHVLAALGENTAAARGAIRLSLGWCSTEDDVERGVAGFLSAMKLASEPAG